MKDIFWFSLGMGAGAATYGGWVAAAGITAGGLSVCLFLWVWRRLWKYEETA